MSFLNNSLPQGPSLSLLQKMLKKVTRMMYFSTNYKEATPLRSKQKKLETDQNEAATLVAKIDPIG